MTGTKVIPTRLTNNFFLEIWLCNLIHIYTVESKLGGVGRSTELFSNMSTKTITDVVQMGIQLDFMTLHGDNKYILHSWIREEE